ncbi:MAG TPA: serine hydrolase domain-containing protein [Blastocatellia bacterium]|nr:serine hydrolase domain-containing protein [Blastocatellia bacterium]
MSKTIIFLLAAISLSQTAAFAQKSRIALIDHFVTAKHKYHNFNGNVLVAEKGRVIYKRSIGYSNFKTRQRLSDRSVFNIASISKQFTAAAVLLCAERGLLSLDDGLSQYFPQIPYEGITVRQMLAHTSGLPEQNELLYKHWDSFKPATNKDMIELLVKERPPAAFKPGADFKYCNTNYSLLASIVEKVTGQRFQDFMAANIFGPAGMRQTQILNLENGHKTIPDLTSNYIFDHEKGLFSLPEDIPRWKKAVPIGGMVGAGNVYSTTTDLLKWQESLKTGKVLSRRILSEMESPHVRASVDGSDAYGYGLAIKSVYGDTKVFHYGGTLGYWNSLQHFKHADRTVIVLSNNEGEKGLTNAIGAILFGQDVALPSAHKEISLAEGQLSKFVGEYELNGNFAFAIEDRNGKLYRVIKSGDARELKPESKNMLFYGDGSDRQIEFVFDPKQAVERVFFISDGLKLELKKSR